MTITPPESVWNQLAIVLVFTGLLILVIQLMTKTFKDAIADINRHYSEIVDATAKQWYKLIDAQQLNYTLVAKEQTDRLEQLTKVIERLSEDVLKIDGKVSEVSSSLRQHAVELSAKIKERE